MNFKQVNRVLKALDTGLTLAYGSGSKNRVLVKRSRMYAGKRIYYTIGVFSPKTLVQGLEDPTWIRPADTQNWMGVRPSDGWNTHQGSWGDADEERMDCKAPVLTSEQLKRIKDALVIAKLSNQISG
jgi:hypothetical protein